MSVFSVKVNVVENKLQNYSQDIIDELRYIAPLTKGGHSLSRVKNRMQILAYYINHSDEKEIASGIKLSEE